MIKFAFVIHPLDAADIASKYKIARYLPRRVVESIIRLAPPVKVSSITGVQSPYGRSEGWLVAVPLTAGQMLNLPESFVTGRIIRAGRLAEKLGAGIVGLGSLASVAGDAGYTADRSLGIAVTTGSSYNLAAALEGIREAALLMGHNPKTAHVVVLDAAEPAGSVLALIIAREVKRMTLVGRDKRSLQEVAGKILFDSGLSAKITCDGQEVLRAAHVVIAASAAAGAAIGPEDLAPGAVVCDLALPGGVGRRVAEVRDEVLVIEGGVVAVPGDVNFNFNLGLPSGTACPRMAETMILAMEGRCESYSLGARISVRQVEEMAALAKKNGFRLAGLRSFGRFMAFAEVANVKAKALEKGLGWCKSG
ncbi:MAG: shikimate dehydrogenase [Bacillota bacterium]